MAFICLYFKVHHPYHLKRYENEEILKSHHYEDEIADASCINKLADECFLPANSVILEAIHLSKYAFKVSFSISGVLLDLFEKYRPDVILSFQQLVNTGCIDILGETYYHSLSSLHSVKEFERQVFFHRQKIKTTFGIEPQVFRNTELIHNNSIAVLVKQMGYKALLCEGIKHILQGREVNRVYQSPGEDAIRLLLRNNGLSDDISFRFDIKEWEEYPLTADKFSLWIHSHDSNTEVINIFLDYETFGIFKKVSSGIFDFLSSLPEAILRNKNWHFATAADVLSDSQKYPVYDVDQTISWDNNAKQACVWSENAIQHNMLKKIYSIENLVIMNNDPVTTEYWRRLQAADYIYYMADDCNRHEGQRYLSPFNNPDDTYRYYRNMITDLETNIIQKTLAGSKINSHQPVLTLY